MAGHQGGDAGCEGGRRSPPDDVRHEARVGSAQPVGDHPASQLIGDDVEPASLVGKGTVERGKPRRAIGHRQVRSLGGQESFEVGEKALDSLGQPAKLRGVLRLEGS